jgi:hypothetical protein
MNIALVMPWGFFCYDENQKYFSETSFKNLAGEYFSEKYTISKSQFYDKQTQDYYDLYVKGFKDVLFDFLVEIKYKSILDRINSKIKPFEESKSYLTQKTSSYGDSQKKLTQSGGVLTGLALIAFDAGASLVPAALSAAGLLVNKKKNNSRKLEIEKFDDQLKALYEEKDLIYDQVNAELIHHSQNLDDFFNCSAKKIMSKYADGSSFHAGYAINLEGNSSLYSPDHKFSITALKVVSTPPKSSLSKEKVSLIRLTVSPLSENNYYPYKDIELLESEKVLNICALLREYSLRGQYYIAIS